MTELSTTNPLSPTETRAVIEMLLSHGAWFQAQPLSEKYPDLAERFNASGDLYEIHFRKCDGLEGMVEAASPKGASDV